MIVYKEFYDKLWRIVLFFYNKNEVWFNGEI